MDKLSFKLGDVEGPLDLILQLISKHKLNIYDIEITKLLEQYLAYLDQMQQLDLEVASDFLEMAARLVHMKTVSLLPKHEELEELKGELAGQLLEYSACKQAAMHLRERSGYGDQFVRPPMELEEDKTYHLAHKAAELFDSYTAAMGRGRRKIPPPVSAFSGIVSRRVVSVNSRIIYILKKLYRREKMGFAELFEESTGRSEMVATFLALLELVKGKRVSVSSNGTQLTFRGRELE